MDREKNFIEYLTNEGYKMLVLKEREDSGETVYLESFIDNLFVETDGACIWSEWLRTNQRYTIVTSIISKNALEYKQYRREIFKMLNLLNKISEEIEV